MCARYVRRGQPQAHFQQNETGQAMRVKPYTTRMAAECNLPANLPAAVRFAAYKIHVARRPRRYIWHEQEGCEAPHYREQRQVNWQQQGTCCRLPTRKSSASTRNLCLNYNHMVR